MNKYKNFLHCDLKGRNILITGASGNLGTEYAKFLSYLGANLILTDINISKLKENFKGKVNVKLFKLDVSNYKDWQKLYLKLKSNKIFVDTLINNAGYTNHSKKENFSKDFFKLDEKSINEVFKVNVFGVLYGCKIFGKDMCLKKKGVIINIASMYALQSPKHHLYKNTNISAPITYAASKSSVISITKYLGTLMAAKKVRVNSICPGGIQDKTHKKLWLKRFGDNNPSGRMGETSELLNTIIYLINEKSSYNNGSNIIIDGGWSAW
ncbi:SDR family oxidoreductase [Candidatus Pelagibacter sp.]|uniref:SDR family oxidoreductase n=1 Tax=Candidatus Pelagibacter sp. TaxID=2024849 RepID=UPI003F83C404